MVIGCTYIASIRVRYALFCALAIAIALQIIIPQAMQPLPEGTNKNNEASSDFIASAESVKLSQPYRAPPTPLKLPTLETLDNLSNPVLGSNRNILLKKGVYTLNETLQIYSNTSIYAEEGTSIHFAGNSYVALTGNDITICGIEVTGNTLNSEFGIRAQGNFITVLNCTVQNIGKIGAFGFGITSEYGNNHALIEGNVVRNTGLDGIHIRGNQETRVIKNIVEDSNDDGIASIFGNNNLIFNNSINRQNALNLAGNGIYVADKGTIVEGNLIENTPLNGITADDFQGYQVSDLKLLNNTINNAGMVDCDIHYGGILLNFVCDSTVYGNIVNGSLYDGIRVYNGSRNTVSYNTIDNTFLAQHSWSASIVLEYQSTYNHIFDNTVGEETFTLIEAGSGVDYNTIHFDEPIPGLIKIEGQSTVIL